MTADPICQAATIALHHQYASVGVALAPLRVLEVAPRFHRSI